MNQEPEKQQDTEKHLLDKLPIGEVIDDLKSMSNNYMVCLESYVIPKSVLDMYIEHLEGRQNAI